MNGLTPIFLASIGIGIAACQAQPTAGDYDISECDNCDAFPVEWLSVDEETAIDFDALPPARQLDFLIGEWELLFPTGKPGDDDYIAPDKPIARENFTWFADKTAIHADQYWGDKDAPGFQARSEYRYVVDQERWQWTWMTSSSYAIMTGGNRDDGTLTFRQFKLSGDQNDLTASPDKNHVQYVFRNVTADQFFQEEWRQDETGTGPYNKLMWRVLFRRISSD